MHDSSSNLSDFEVLFDSHKTAILEDGYTVIRGGITPDLVSELLNRLQKIIRLKMKSKNFDEGGGYITDLQNEDIFFIKVIFNHSLLRSLLIDLLNDPFYRNIPEHNPNYIFRGIRALSAVERGLPLHIDSVVPSSGRRPTGIVTSFILEDHFYGNGCTLVVPKTHRSDRYADRGATDKVIAVLANAGDIVLWDTRLWHGTADNPKRKSRLSLLCTFTSWHLKQPLCHYETLPDHIYKELTDEEKSVIGFCSIPPRENLPSHTDSKFGYEYLADKANF